MAGALAPHLGERPRDIEQRLASDRPFVWVKVKIPPAAAEAIRAHRLPGIGTVPEALRFYPNRELAAQILGFVGRDDRGLEGVELAHDKSLAGEAGLALVERDALGREMTGQPTILKAPTPGTGLVLTIDATVQYLAERELEAAWRATGAKAGMVLVMDPRTGEILAMAMRPTFNPNAYQVATAEQWRNRAVTDPFEPGSTFKAILAAAALEDGVVKPGDRFYGEQGVITIANRTIHDWKKYGWLTFQQVLQYSSNVGAIKVGLQLGPGAVLPARHGVRLREPHGRRPPRREPRAAPPARPVVRAVPGEHLDRPGGVGDRGPDARGVRRHRQRRPADAAPHRPRRARSERPGSAADGAPGRAAGDLARRRPRPSATS